MQQVIDQRRNLRYSSSSCSSSSSDTAIRVVDVEEEVPAVNLYNSEKVFLSDAQRKHEGAPTDGGSNRTRAWLTLSDGDAMRRSSSLSSFANDPSISDTDIELRRFDGNNLEFRSQSSSSSFDDDAANLESTTFDAAVGCLKSPADTAQQPKRVLRRLRESFVLNTQPLDVEKYVAARLMTKTQERWNALTMIPPSLFCVLYLFSAAWIGSDLIEQAKKDYILDPLHFTPVRNTGLAGWLNDWLGNSFGCLDYKFGPPALPPLTILALGVGTCFHMPFSFLYHWKYAHKLENLARVHHWSRKMDQSMIHFAAACLAYAASGSSEYFFACALFNLDCARRHFLPHYRPRSNQVRIGIAILIYSLPILRRGDLDRFALLWLIVGVSIWLFSQYPIGGWSHVAFHVVIGLLTPLMAEVAAELPIAQTQRQLAAQCSVLLQH